LPHFTRALRHRNYRLFFSGQLISLVGTWMQGIAESWLVYRLTGSAALLGVAGFASQIPVLFLATIGGSVADRYNRHRILVVTQTASMILPLTLAALVFSGRVQVWHVFALAAGLGIVNAFDVPARQSFVVEMVGKEDLVNAIALNSSIVNAARAIGPAVAGILMAAVGEGWCFLINGVSYIAVITGLLMMKLPPRLQTDRPPAAFAHVTHGFRYVRATTPVRDLLLMVGLVSFAGMPYSTLMPIFAEEILHGGARGLGLLMASAGVGSLCGALMLASRSTVRGLGRVVGASALVFGLALMLFAMSRVYWL
jgi:MFS family permease